jgi:hypothetical protein
MTTPQFDDQPPESPSLTEYDERHLATYLRLLDAASEGAQWEEVARVVFGLDPVRDRERAQRVHHGHLARARWITEHGYLELLNTVRH